MTSQLSDEMKTFLTSVNDSSASGPSSRPRPDCFIPPNGVQYRTEECELTLSAPVSTACDTRSARPRSRVHSEPDRPYSVSLASRTASSSVRNGSTDSTGPKTSSRQCRSPVDWASSTVGGNHQPSPDGAWPANATSAPSTYDATVSRWPDEISGPISAVGFAGSSTRNALTAGSSRDRNRSY